MSIYVQSTLRHTEFLLENLLPSDTCWGIQIRAGEMRGGSKCFLYVIQETHPIQRTVQEWPFIVSAKNKKNRKREGERKPHKNFFVLSKCGIPSLFIVGKNLSSLSLNSLLIQWSWIILIEWALSQFICMYVYMYIFLLLKTLFSYYSHKIDRTNSQLF